MTSTDDSASPLARAAARRHQHTLRAATEAIERLDRDACLINFSVVARQADNSRGWLYRQPEIRDLITRLRSTHYAAPATRLPAPAGRSSRGRWPIVSPIDRAYRPERNRPG